MKITLIILLAVSILLITGYASNRNKDAVSDNTVPEIQAQPKSVYTTESKEMVIMSQNILTTSKALITAVNRDGSMTRGDTFISILENCKPSSIGLQEVTEDWKEYIERTILTTAYSGGAAYAMAGLQSDSGKPLKSGSSEYSPVLYRRDLYDAAFAGGFWFSETPDIPSSYESIYNPETNRLLHTGMRFRRVFAYVVLKYKDTGDTAYIHINTHFDHKSDDYINTLCAAQIAKKAGELGKKYDCPVVMTGDFNSHEDKTCYAYLADKANGFVDAKYLTEARCDKSTTPGYAGNFNLNDSKDIIDHVFISYGRAKVIKHDIVDNAYLSDHSSVLVKLQFLY